ncbi:MAG: NAD(P)H-hydrate epimerase [Actinomycetota bacterium]
MLAMDVTPLPLVRAGSLAWIDTAQMVEVDRVMVEDLHIQLVQMMENAGRNLARLVVALHRPATVAVYAGSGGNGGGGLVAARHLANHGVEVTVVTTRPRDEMTPVPAHQLDIVERMGIAVGGADPGAEVAVDAVIGYSLRGAPQGRSAELIGAVNAHPDVVSLDVPSGLDTGTGQTPGVHVRAGATLTLAMPKVGLRGRPEVGRLFLGDISVPAAVYDAFGASVPPTLFADGPVLEVR